MRKLHISAIIAMIIISILALEISVSASSSSFNLQIDHYALPERTIIIDPMVEQEMNTLQDGEQITVIVTLSNQADVTQIPGASRAARLQGVIRALQAFADADQKQIKAYLNAQSAMGNVSNFSPFWIFNGLTVTATQEVIQEVSSRADVAKITPDKIQVETVSEAAQAISEPNLSVIQAPALWDLGFQGQGIVVANMDSGVDANHPDLASNWRGGSNSWYDPFGEHPSTPADLSGHGTWTMGVMVGGASGGTSIGVAPQAEWIAAKIFDDSGSSTATAIHLAFQWLMDPDGDPATSDAPHVVNNSWTFSAPGCNLEFEIDLQSLRAASILPVFAAGNGGPYSNTSYSPANNPSAFSVGATDNYDMIYAYSSRGPTDCGDTSRVFPDLVAPGVDILTSDLYSTYTFATGTSLAAPHVTGGLALLFSAFSDLSADHQENALVSSSVDLGTEGEDNTFGYGRLDLLSAYDWLDSNPNPTPTPDPTINLALNQPVAVSSAKDASLDGPMAVDGDLGTYWQTAKASGKNKLPAEWIEVDLGADMSIGRVLMEWGSNYATEYSIQVSLDQNQWVTVSTTTSGDGGMDEIIFTVVSARYIKMNSTEWDNSTWRISLEEFEVYSGGGDDPAPTPEPTPTPGPGQYMHIGDLGTASFSEPRNRWTARVTILVHDDVDLPVSGVTVSGTWSEGVSGSGSCTTDAFGSCTIEKNKIKGNVPSVRFDVIDLTHTDYQYLPSANHNANGESIEPFVTVLQP